MLVTTYKLTRCYSPGDHSVTFRPLKASNLIPLFCVCGCVLATTNITPHEPPAGLRSSSTDIHYCNIAFSVFSCILDDVINEGGCEAPPARPQKLSFVLHPDGKWHTCSWLDHGRTGHCCCCINYTFLRLRRSVEYKLPRPTLILWVATIWTPDN